MNSAGSLLPLHHYSPHRNPPNDKYSPSDALHSKCDGEFRAVFSVEGRTPQMKCLVRDTGCRVVDQFRVTVVPLSSAALESS